MNPKILNYKVFFKLSCATLALLLLVPLFSACATDGLSAYEIALKNGSASGMSEEEWLASLAGRDGRDGADGKSAFELACEAGFKGSVTEWLASLAGQDGKDGKNGAEGKSAYEVAVAQGYTKSEAEWVAELLGNKEGSGVGSGVGISSVYVNADRHLIILLTNNTIIDAGYVGVADEKQPDPNIGKTDADGYIIVDERVVVIASLLNIRSSPDSSSDTNIVATLPSDTELQRVGVGSGNITWSKVIYNGRVCYAASRYLEVSASQSEVDLTGIEIPRVNLLDSYTLLVGTQTCFEVDQFVLGLASDMYTSFKYSGTGEVRLTPGSIAIKPTAAETAHLTFYIRKFISGRLEVIYSKTVKLVSIYPAPLPLVGLVIGDSRISDGTLVNTLKSNFGASLTLIGTLKTSDGVAHEGRGAWSTANYALTSEALGRENPFLNPGKSKFDFEYYLARTGLSCPDFVVFNLGANDDYSALSIQYYTEMINSILAYNAAHRKSVKILIMTEYLSPPDGYSISYITDIAVKRELQFEYFSRQYAAFGNRETEGIYLIPNYIVIDNDADRIWGEVSVSERGGRNEMAITDVIHLSASGYKKEADIITAYIYSIFSAG